MTQTTSVPRGKKDAPPNGPAGLNAADRALGQFIEQQLAAGTGTLYRDTVQRVTRQLLVQVLQHTAGNQVQASRLLGITRGCLRARIRDMGITIARTVEIDQG